MSETRHRLMVYRVFSQHLVLMFDVDNRYSFLSMPSASLAILAIRPVCHARRAIEQA